MLKDKVLAELVDSGHAESVYEMIEPAFSLIELPDNKKLMEDHKKNFNEYNEMFKKILGSPLFMELLKKTWLKLNELFS